MGRGLVGAQEDTQTQACTPTNLHRLSGNQSETSDDPDCPKSGWSKDRSNRENVGTWGLLA